MVGFVDNGELPFCQFDPYRSISELYVRVLRDAGVIIGRHRSIPFWKLFSLLREEFLRVMPRSAAHLEKAESRC